MFRLISILKYDWNRVYAMHVHFDTVWLCFLLTIFTELQSKVTVILIPVFCVLSYNCCPENINETANKMWVHVDISRMPLTLLHHYSKSLVSGGGGGGGGGVLSFFLIRSLGPQHLPLAPKNIRHFELPIKIFEYLATSKNTHILYFDIKK